MDVPFPDFPLLLRRRDGTQHQCARCTNGRYRDRCLERIHLFIQKDLLSTYYAQGTDLCAEIEQKMRCQSLPPRDYAAAEDIQTVNRDNVAQAAG